MKLVPKGYSDYKLICENDFLLTHDERVNELLKEKNQKSNPLLVQKSLKLTKEEEVALSFMKNGVSLERVAFSTKISIERLHDILLQKGEK